MVLLIVDKHVAEEKRKLDFYFTVIQCIRFDIFNAIFF